MLVVHAAFPIAAEHHERATELIRELAEDSRKEEGIIEYRVATDVDDENLFRFFEQYEDEEAVESHTQTDHYQEFEAALPDLLSGEPEILRFDINSVSELEL